MADFNVGFVIFPGITQLDFTGPFEVLSRLGTPPSLSAPSKFPQSKVHVIAKTMLPVVSDRGLGILPTCTFENCPALDLICVPGGAGVVEALADAETIDFIRRQGGRAEYVTSVCMGAFLLGAAGLLKGRRAATHWAYVDLLPLVGARHEKGRVVRDGNVFTSGGVSAGIDFGFHRHCRACRAGGRASDPARDRVRPISSLRFRPPRQGIRSGDGAHGSPQRKGPHGHPGGTQDDGLVWQGLAGSPTHYPNAERLIYGPFNGCDPPLTSFIGLANLRGARPETL